MFLPAIQTPSAQAVLTLPPTGAGLLETAFEMGEGVEAATPPAKPAKGGPASKSSEQAGTDAPDAAVASDFGALVFPDSTPAPAQDTSVKAHALRPPDTPNAPPALEQQAEDVSLGVLPAWLKTALATAPIAPEPAETVAGPADTVAMSSRRVTAEIPRSERPIDVAGVPKSPTPVPGADPTPSIVSDPTTLRAAGSTGSALLVPPGRSTPAASQTKGAFQSAPNPVALQVSAAVNTSAATTVVRTLPAERAESPRAPRPTSVAPPPPPSPPPLRSEPISFKPSVPPTSEPQGLDPNRLPTIMTPGAHPSTFLPPSRDQVRPVTGDVIVTVPLTDHAARAQPNGRDGSATEVAPSRAPVALPQLQMTVTQRLLALAPPPVASPEGVRNDPAQTRTTEVELAPAELGKLKLTLQTTERGLHLIVAVERPEAIDAVRRHLETLHRALLSEGVTLDGLDIEAGSQRQDQASAQDKDAPHFEADQSLPETSVEGPAPPAARPVPAGHLDLSL